MDLDEFTDEIEPWIIDELKAIGCDTAKSVLDLPDRRSGCVPTWRKRRSARSSTSSAEFGNGTRDENVHLQLTPSRERGEAIKHPVSISLWQKQKNDPTQQSGQGIQPEHGPHRGLP